MRGIVLQEVEAERSFFFSCESWSVEEGKNIFFLQLNGS